jgi:hypothetical protein
MSRSHRKNDSTEKRQIKYRGICAAARHLGVDRRHLYEVLEGKRFSRRIQSSPLFASLKSPAK